MLYNFTADGIINVCNVGKNKEIYKNVNTYFMA